MTPGTFEATNSASSRWNCQLAVPVRVTKPSATWASTVAGTRVFECQRVQDVAAEVCVCAPFVVHDLHVELVVDVLDAVDALRVLLRLVLLPQAADRAAKRDDAFLGRDGDRGAVDLRSQMSSSETVSCSSSFDMFELLSCVWWPIAVPRPMIPLASEKAPKTITSE